jgi:hypothetical protein
MNFWERKRIPAVYCEGIGNEGVQKEFKHEPELAGVTKNNGTLTRMNERTNE